MTPEEYYQNIKSKWFSLEGILEHENDEEMDIDTLTDKFLEWVESQGLRYCGTIKPTNLEEEGE